jgi:hypothetical protein
MMVFATRVECCLKGIYEATKAFSETRKFYFNQRGRYLQLQFLICEKNFKVS